MHIFRQINIDIKYEYRYKVGSWKESITLSVISFFKNDILIILVDSYI